MIFTKLEIDGAYLIEPEPYNDNRGFFARGFCKKELKDKTGIDFDVCQANISYNIKKGTIRGMHYQIPPYEEQKIVSCVKGAIFDVVLDLRKDSKTYLKWLGFELSEDNYKMLLIPKGCAHGFQSLVDNTVLNYKVDQYFNPAADSGVRYNDPLINIDFPIKTDITISDKDKKHEDWIY